MHDFAVDLTKIRRAIDARTSNITAPQKVQHHEGPAIRSRKGMTYSTKARDTQNLSVADYHKFERSQAWRTGKMSRRHLKDLSADERIGIIHSYLEEHLFMKDVAAKYHISVGLVGRLVAQYKSDSNMINEQRSLEDHRS